LESIHTDSLSFRSRAEAGDRRRDAAEARRSLDRVLYEDGTRTSNPPRRPARRETTALVVVRYRRFESISLPRRVSSEPMEQSPSFNPWQTKADTGIPGLLVDVGTGPSRTRRPRPLRNRRPCSWAGWSKDRPGACVAAADGAPPLRNRKFARLSAGGSRIRTIGSAWHDQGFGTGSCRLCGIVEMSADDAKYLIPYGWTKLAEI